MIDFPEYRPEHEDEAREAARAFDRFMTLLVIVTPVAVLAFGAWLFGLI